MKMKIVDIWFRTAARDAVVYFIPPTQQIRARKLPVTEAGRAVYQAFENLSSSKYNFRLGWHKIRINRDTVPAATLTRVAQKISDRSNSSLIITMPAARKIMEKQPIIMPDNGLLPSTVLSELSFVFIELTKMAASTRRPPIMVPALKVSPSRQETADNGTGT